MSCIISCRKWKPHTLLYTLVLRQVWHVFIQQVSQGLSVGQQLLVGSSKLFILLVSVLTQLPFGMQNASEDENMSKKCSERTVKMIRFCNLLWKKVAHSPVLSLNILQLPVVLLQVFSERCKVLSQKVLEGLLFLCAYYLARRKGQTKFLSSQFHLAGY